MLQRLKVKERDLARNEIEISAILAKFDLDRIKRFN